MRVLIVGCGYIGTSLGAELVRLGHDVSGLSRNAASRTEIQTAGISPVAGDITRAQDLKLLPPSWDWVVNCVSSSGGTIENYRGVYLQGMHNLLNWLSHSPPQKFIYTSSTSVYGQTDGSVVDENKVTEPDSETARILLETEATLLEAASQRGFPGAILRLSGIYGPGRCYWLKQFVNGEARIDGDGQRILNMVHRDDAVGAIIAALRRGKAGRIYNVTDDEPVRQLDLFKWLSLRLGKPLPPASDPIAVRDRKRGVTNKRVSNARLKTELEYRFKHPTYREGFAAI